MAIEGPASMKKTCKHGMPRHMGCMNCISDALDSHGRAPKFPVSVVQFSRARKTASPGGFEKTEEILKKRRNDAID